MATVKVTFTLDRPTVDRLQDAATRLARPKSEVVRDAILDYYERIGQLSQRERLAMLRTFDELVPKIPSRSRAAVEKELSQLRQARRSGGRRAGRRKS
ncbi:MAG TPA: ribbon-helix-helix protein, CopG family [Bryobacteraceae bacterium]|nr:ribbon-helix-helix protein, CopG family [Bryobacteraceae bacterium]